MVIADLLFRHFHPLKALLLSKIDRNLRRRIPGNFAEVAKKRTFVKKGFLKIILDKNDVDNFLLPLF